MTSKVKINNFDHSKLEEKIYKQWLEKNLFSANPSSKKKKFTIIMPPPNVTGSLHIGHALNMTLQDILTRYWRMNNKDVLWQPGTDHAGIATQNIVEKKLISESKINKSKLGKKNFLKEIWNWKKKSGEEIVNQIKKIGASPDWSRLKFTMDDDVSEAVNHAFTNLYKKGLIYKDKRLINWDIKLQTAISDLEVEQKEQNGVFVYLKYFLENSKKYLSIATTRPETLFGDTCVAVNPKDKRYTNLIGKKVKIPLTNKLIPIISDSYVDPKKGSGVLKVTPAHDFNDYKIGKKYNLKFVNIFDKYGKFNEEVPKKYIGLDRILTRENIIKDLDKEGNLQKIEKIKHSVPYGDRSGSIIEPYLTDQWFLDVRKMSNHAVQQVKSKKTKFYPESWTKTFFIWMKEIEPWCISRQIWWGHQIPVWYGPDRKIFCAKNIQEANFLAKKFYSKDVTLVQETDVLDTWFSSSLWPMSTLGWPKKNNTFNKYFPTNILITGFDIIFFWVARMIMQSCHFTNKTPFSKVYIHALVRDKNGQKMSKSKGNVIDPLKIIEIFGADPLRLTLSSMAAQGRDIKLSEDKVKINRNFTTKIWNAYLFLYKNKCINNKFILPKNIKNEINLWVIEECNKFIANVSRDIENFKFNDASKNIVKFTKNIFCDWYLEFLKITLYSNKDETVKETAITASYLFNIILRVAHPIIPFITDEIYFNLIKNKTFITQTKWPKILKFRSKSSAKLNVNELILFISNIRNKRSTLSIEAKSVMNIYYSKDLNKKLNFIKKHNLIIKKLAKVELHCIDTKNFKKSSLIKFMHKGNPFYLDVIKETVANETDNKKIFLLKKELNHIDKEIKRLESKLDNSKFIEKAPKEIVEANKLKLKTNLNLRLKVTKEIKKQI